MSDSEARIRRAGAIPKDEVRLSEEATIVLSDGERDRSSENSTAARPLDDFVHSLVGQIGLGLADGPETAVDRDHLPPPKGWTIAA